MLLHQRDKIRGRITRQRRFREMRIRGKKMLRLAVNIGEVTAPAAGYQYLLPRPLGALQNHHAPPPFARFDRAHQPRCASPKNHHVEFMNHVAFVSGSSESSGLAASESGTFSRDDAASPAPMRLEWTYAAEDILDHLHGPRPDCRYGASSLVGAGRDDSHWLRELVVRLPQRLVLARFS